MALLVFVAFAGGLLAMVTIARWQPGSSRAPAPVPVTSAQPAPGPQAGDGELAQAGPAVVAEPGSRQLAAPEFVYGASSDPDPREAASATATDPTPGTDARVEPPVEQRPESEDPHRGGSRGRRSADSEPKRPGDDTPASSSGSIGAPAPRPGRFGQAAGASKVANAPQAIFANPAESSGGRPAPRSQASAPPVDPEERSSNAGALPDRPETPGFDDTPEPRPDPEQTDRPSENNDPQPDPEPETPQAVVRMVPMSAVFAVDDVVPVSIEIYSGTDVGHVPFYVKYDPRVLEFDRGVEGSFLGSDGAPTAFFARASSGGDAVVIGLSRMGQGPGIDGAGTLCVLEFVAVGQGTTALRFSRAKVRDSTSGIMPASFENATLTVN